jgi:hypothetical protein
LRRGGVGRGRLSPPNWKESKPNDLSPGVNLLKSFLLRPDIVPMSVSAGATTPTPVKVTATLGLLPAGLGASPG